VTTPSALRSPGCATSQRRAGRTGIAELLSLEHFDIIRGLAMRHAGLALADHKRSLVHRRVCKRLAALGLTVSRPIALF
jgi:CheR methyltransferase-like protein